MRASAYEKLRIGRRFFPESSLATLRWRSQRRGASIPRVRAQLGHGVAVLWCVSSACGSPSSGSTPADVGGGAGRGGSSSAIAGNGATGGKLGAAGETPAASAVGAPTVRITPGAWKCPDNVSGTPAIAGASPTRVAGVPPADGFSTANSFASGNIEGPVWIGDALYLSELSSDAYDNSNTQVKKARILRVKSDDSVSVFIADSGSNGLAVDGSGAIVAAVHKDGTLTRFTLPDATPSYVATGYMALRFDAPNDLVIRSDGNIYFSDPAYQAPAVAPQAATRVYRVTPDGNVLALADSFINPNGVTLSLDEKWLYVAAQTGRRYALASDGSVGAGETFTPTSGADGVVMDCAGNLYVARGREVVVYDASAKSLGSIRVPEVQAVTNLAFGGDDHKTLYVTGLGSRLGLFKVPLSIPGRPY